MVVGAPPAFKTFENSALQQGNTVDQSQCDAQSARVRSRSEPEEHLLKQLYLVLGCSSVPAAFRSITKPISINISTQICINYSIHPSTHYSPLRLALACSQGEALSCLKPWRCTQWEAGQGCRATPTSLLPSETASRSPGARTQVSGLSGSRGAPQAWLDEPFEVQRVI